MSRADPQRLGDYLRHILEAIDHIQSYTAGMDLAAFRADRKPRMRSSETWKSLARRATTLPKIILLLRRRIRPCHGDLLMKCATHCRMVILRLTLT